jgi:HK97 family phage major capsid protein
MDRCMVKRAVTGSAQFPRLTQSTNRFGVVAAWGTEGTASTEDNPVFSRQDVDCGQLGLLSQLSLREMRNNRVGLEAELAWMFRGAMDEQITRAILQGNAANSRPQGINHNTAIAAGVNVVGRETAAQVSYTDLVRLQFAVEDAIFEDGIFIFRSGNNGALRYVSALDDNQGRPVLRNDNIGWREGVGAVRTIAGSEFIATPDNTATLGNRGDVIYGDFRNYGVAVDLDVTIDRSDHYAFNAGLATFRVVAYIGGYPIGPNAFSMLGDVSTASSSSSSSST